MSSKRFLNRFCLAFLVILSRRVGLNYLSYNYDTGSFEVFFKKMFFKIVLFLDFFFIQILFSYKLLYVKQIKNQVLLHSTGKYIQYPVTNHNGKNTKKRIYVYVYNFEALMSLKTIYKSKNNCIIITNT